MSYLFPSDRSLLYPQFETYRLHPLDADSNTTSFPLPGSGATQSRVGYNSHHLSFKEVRARIGWDHLSVRDRVGVYIDKEWNVVGFQLDDGFQPHFTTLAQLPTPVSSSQTQPEYPSAIPLSDTHWAISSGSGYIYILELSLSPNLSGSFIARYDLPGPSLLRSAHSSSPSKSRLLLSRTVPMEGKPKPTQQKEFQLYEVSLDPTRRNGVDDGAQEAEVVWKSVSSDLPYWTGWWEDGWVVLSGEVFGDEDDTERKEMEEERIRREKLDTTGKRGLGAEQPEEPVSVSTSTTVQSADQGVTSAPGDPNDGGNGQEKAQEYAYSWTQTAEALSVKIPLPAGTTRSNVSISLTSSELTLSLRDAPEVLSPLAEFLRKATRRWWSDIDLAASTYSFDPAPNGPKLELELVKIDTSTRWPSAFFPSEEDDDDVDDVPETLDDNMLASVRATFDNIRTREPHEPEGNHPAIPALLREEMDFDMDDEEDYDAIDGAFADSGSKVGREVFLGYIKSETGEAKWSKTTTTVVSTPFRSHSTVEDERLGNGDGNGETSSERQLGIMVKSAVDGLLFSPAGTGDITKSPWKHQSTTPALAFVLSSKRDIRLVRHFTTSTTTASAAEPETKRQRIDDATHTHVHTGDKSETKNVVLAFDAGSSGSDIGHGQGNVYVYYPPSSGTIAQQGVMGVSGGERGAMLGVGIMSVKGERMVAVLCEKELVLLKGVL